MKTLFVPLLLAAMAGNALASDLSPRSDLGRGDLPGSEQTARAPGAPAIRGNNVLLTQRGNANDANITVQGRGNDVTLSQRGSNNQATIAATGDNSRIGVGQNGSAHSVDIQVIGNNRVIEVQQSGHGRRDKVILH